MHLPNDIQTPQSPALLLTIDEAARALRLGRVSIYKLIAQGKLPLVKIGRSTRLRAADVRAFADALPARQAAP